MEDEPEIRIEMSDGKAPGYVSITAEELKASGESGIDILHKLYHLIWHKESFETDWGTAIITPIFKKDWLNCGIYRGISLLSVTNRLIQITCQSVTYIFNIFAFWYRHVL